MIHHDVFAFLPQALRSQVGEKKEWSRSNHGEESDMGVHMTIELRNREGAQTVVQALEAYKVRLRAGIERTKQRLAEFEARYRVDTAGFLQKMTAEDLEGGDLEYVEWAGEAKLLEGLEAELRELEDARYQLP